MSVKSTAASSICLTCYCFVASGEGDQSRVDHQFVTGHRYLASPSQGHTNGLKPELLAQSYRVRHSSQRQIARDRHCQAAKFTFKPAAFSLSSGASSPEMSVSFSRTGDASPEAAGLVFSVGDTSPESFVFFPNMLFGSPDDKRVLSAVGDASPEAQQSSNGPSDAARRSGDAALGTENSSPVVGVGSPPRKKRSLRASEPSPEATITSPRAGDVSLEAISSLSDFLYATCTLGRHQSTLNPTRATLQMGRSESLLWCRRQRLCA